MQGGVLGGPNARDRPSALRGKWNQIILKQFFAPLVASLATQHPFFRYRFACNLNFTGYVNMTRCPRDRTCEQEHRATAQSTSSVNTRKGVGLLARAGSYVRAGWSIRARRFVRACGFVRVRFRSRSHPMRETARVRPAPPSQLGRELRPRDPPIECQDRLLGAAHSCERRWRSRLVALSRASSTSGRGARPTAVAVLAVQLDAPITALPAEPQARPPPLDPGVLLASKPLAVVPAGI